MRRRDARPLLQEGVREAADSGEPGGGILLHAIGIAAAAAAIGAGAPAWAQAPASGAAPEARAESRTEPVARVLIHPDAKVTPVQREQLQRHADLGIDALRRYVEITQGIYHWRLKDLLRPS